MEEERKKGETGGVDFHKCGPWRGRPSHHIHWTTSCKNAFPRLDARHSALGTEGKVLEEKRREAADETEM